MLVQPQQVQCYVLETINTYFKSYPGQYMHHILIMVTYLCICSGDFEDFTCLLLAKISLTGIML